VSLEVIVVDDGSTDETAIVASELGPKVKVIRIPNGGQAAARNRGVIAAHGELLAFLDADDWWESDKLISQNKLFESDSQIDVCFSDFKGLDEFGIPFGWQGGLREQMLNRGIEMTPVAESGFVLSNVTYALIRYLSFIHPSTVVVRRAFFDKVGGFDESMTPAEDLELWIRMASLGRFSFVDRVLATVEARLGSQGRKYTRMDEQLPRLYSGWVRFQIADAADC
jgi:glycosyltransferase involved in cell wall biosynthesis